MRLALRLALRLGLWGRSGTGASSWRWQDDLLRCAVARLILFAFRLLARARRRAGRALGLGSS